MSVELLKNLSLISFIVAGAFVAASVAIFFLLDIRKVIGDVTGSTARKAINNIRRQNESTGNKAYKSSPVNIARGKTTDEITPSGKTRESNSGMGVSVGTEKFDTAKLAMQAQETAVLSTSSETTVLDNQSGATTVLDQNMPGAETTVLSDLNNQTLPENAEHPTGFSKDIEMGFSDSTETIE